MAPPDRVHIVAAPKIHAAPGWGRTLSESRPRVRHRDRPSGCGPHVRRPRSTEPGPTAASARTSTGPGPAAAPSRHSAAFIPAGPGPPPAPPLLSVTPHTGSAPCAKLGVQAWSRTTCSVVSEQVRVVLRPAPLRLAQSSCDLLRCDLLRTRSYSVVLRLAPD